MSSGFSVDGKRVAVVGAARSGIAAALLLARRGARVTLSEFQAVVPEADALSRAGVTIESGGHQMETFVDADLVVMSPGVPPEIPPVAAARAHGIPVVSEVELASRWLKGRLIAITGTKGKSTTTTLIGRMAEASGYRVAVGGNIGHALSDQVDASTPDTLHVVETSSFQLELIDTFRPWISVMLNLSPDHLNRHATFDDYAAAKGRIFENQSPEDWTVVNADDPGVLRLAAGAKAMRKTFSRLGDETANTIVEDGWIVMRSKLVRKPLLPLSAVHLIGPHLVDDVMAAATVSAIIGATTEAMTAAVDSFRGLEHAMELVAERGDVRFVNDSKATNVDAARRAIESFEAGLVPIMGGQFKGGDLDVLREPLRVRARAVVAIGEAQSLIAGAFGDVVPVERAGSMDEAVGKAYALAQPAGVVLLAPACASFDMFRDYAERGARFKEAVGKLML